MRFVDELEADVNRDVFKLKGVLFSDEDPLEALADDGLSITAAEMK